MCVAAGLQEPTGAVATTAWNDWLTESMYRVRISLRAAERLRSLSSATQQKLRDMIEDIAELAALSTESTRRAWNVSFSRPLLELRVDNVSLRYRIDEDARTLAIEHVVVLDEPEGEPELDVG